MEALLLMAVVAWLAAKYGAKTRKQAGNGKLEEIKQRTPGGQVSPGHARRIKATHNVAWWFGEVLRGFPVHRTGWHAGWLTHKTAALHQAAVRDEARDTHDGLRQSLKASREARREQFEQVTDALPSPGAGKEAVREAVDNVVRGPWSALGVSRRLDGQPETDADKRFFDQRGAGYQGPIDQDGHAVPDLGAGERTGYAEDADGNPHLLIVRPDTGYFTPPGPKRLASTPDRDDALARAQELSRDGREINVTARHDDGSETVVAQFRGGEPVPVDAHAIPQPSNGGAQVPTGNPTAEATYGLSLQKANHEISVTEVDLAQLRARKAAATVEAIAASVGDPTLAGHLANADDALSAQIKAAEDHLEHWTGFKNDLVSRHGAGADYHQSAANGGASREFLKE